jgi:hypothetical protein
MTATDDAFYIGCIDATPFLKDRSKTTIKNALRKLIRDVQASNIHDLLMNPDVYGPKSSVLEYPAETLKTYMTSILSLFNYSNLKSTRKDVYNKWYKWYLKARKVIVRQKLDRVPTDRMKKAHMEWEDIVKRVIAMEPGTREHLLMCMITMIPPRRQSDWYNVKVYTQKNFKPKLDHNYINLYWEKPYIILVDYKTSSYYGVWYKNIPKNLLEVARASVTKEPREYLFVDAYGNPFKRAEAFALWSNRTIKRVLENDLASMNMLRHSFAAYIHRVNPNMTLRERIYIAKDMGHNVMQNLSYDFTSKTNQFRNAVSQHTTMPGSQ